MTVGDRFVRFVWAFFALLLMMRLVPPSHDVLVAVVAGAFIGAIVRSAFR